MTEADAGRAARDIGTLMPCATGHLEGSTSSIRAGSGPPSAGTRPIPGAHPEPGRQMSFAAS